MYDLFLLTIFLDFSLINLLDIVYATKSIRYLGNYKLFISFSYYTLLKIQYISAIADA